MDFLKDPDLARFVSSTQDVLEQFKHLQVSDRVTFRVFSDVLFDKRNADKEAMDEALSLHTSLSTFFVQHSADKYLWYKEACSLFVAVPPPSSSSSSSSSSGSTFELFLQGSLRYGDCIDDEWYLVYLLMEMSKAMPFLSICVSDSDGQFLLIEASDVIPSWLGPENSFNRIWIRAGAVHIIPLDEPGKTREGGIRLKSALEALRSSSSSSSSSKSSSSSSYKASSKVQRCIEARTTGAFPAQISASTHLAPCLLPRSLARLLQDKPQVLSKIVHAFCASEVQFLDALASGAGGGGGGGKSKGKEKLKMLQSMARLGSHVDGQEAVVLVAVRFTRSLYARLTFEPFQVPKKLLAFMNRAKEVPCASLLASRLVGTSGGSAAVGSVSAGTVSRAAAQAADLGVRLVCGLEIAYQKSLVAKEKQQQIKTLGASHSSRAAMSALFANLRARATAGQTGSGGGAGKVESVLTEISQVTMFEDLFVRGVVRAGRAPDTEKEWLQRNEYASKEKGDDDDEDADEDEEEEDEEDQEADQEEEETEKAEAALCAQIDTHLLQSASSTHVAWQPTLPSAFDSDAWLHMTPEELDREMKSRLDRFQHKPAQAEEGGKGEEGEKGQGARGEDEEEEEDEGEDEEEGNAVVDASSMDEVKKIVEGVSRFMEEESEISGISNRVAKKKKQTTTTTTTKGKGKGKGRGEEEDDGGGGGGGRGVGGLSVDLEKMLALVDAAAAGTSTEERKGEQAHAGDEGYFTSEDEDEDDVDDDEEEEEEGEEKEEEEEDVEEVVIDTHEKSAREDDDLLSTSASTVGRGTFTIGIDEVKRGGGGGGRGGQAPGASKSDSKHQPLYDEADDDDDDDDFDSDDEQEGQCDEEEEEEEDEHDDEDEDNEAFHEEYFRLMEMELMNTSLADTFERVKVPSSKNSSSGGGRGEGGGGGGSDDDTSSDVPPPVDVEANLLKYLLESHASQQGTHGPSSQLLSQLGIKLPDAPKLSKKVTTVEK